MSDETKPLQVKALWTDEQDREARALAQKFNPSFYLWHGYKGWNRRWFGDSSSDAAEPSNVQLWHALMSATRREAELVDALRRVLNVGRGTSGRLILEREDEEFVRAALSLRESKGSEQG